VTGRLLLAKSYYWIRGFHYSNRVAGRSWFRRFFLALLIWCVLLGSGIGFLWESANIFLHMTTGESMKVKTIAKWAGWWRVHEKPVPQRGE
jgi:hypothetical protein